MAIFTRSSRIICGADEQVGSVELGVLWAQVEELIVDPETVAVASTLSWSWLIVITGAVRSTSSSA